MGDTSAVPLRRVILILLPVLLLAVGGYWWLSRPDYVVFAQGLRAVDAAALVAELDKRGTPYRLAGGGATILVPADRADDIRVALAGSDVAARGLVGFELFNESDMGLTNFAQKINYQRALQGELTRTILKLDGIADARVHLALPEKALFRGDRTEASAAVAIEMKPGAVLDPARVAGIQRLVAAAAIDLPEARVVVLDGAGRQIGGGGVTDAGVPDERQALRQLFAARAGDAIAAVRPGRAPRVTVRIVEDGPVAWDGGERNFPLAVQVQTPSALTGDERDRMTEAVNGALAIDTGRGDAVTFVTGPVDPVASPMPSTSIASDAATFDRELPSVSARPGWDWWIAATLACAVLAAIALWRRRRRPALDSVAHAAFALRLRQTLEAADARG